MPNLTIVADIRVSPAHLEHVKKELLKLIEPTLAEPGCIQYDLHEDNQTPEHFLFFEVWESRELWQQHMQSPHLKALLTATDGMIESLSVHEMSKIPDVPG